MTPVEIRTSTSRYDALVGANLLDNIGKLVSQHLPAGQCAIVTDTNVAALFADRVHRSLAAAGFKSSVIKISPGEKSKSLEQVSAICDQLIAARLDRSSFLVALGGGVVGDLTGFVAAIFHRGIPYVQVPTTLLAQVDSSIGGKTAVNTATGKNLLGALHHPVMVIADVDLLQTLPPRELNQGFAEIIKHAIIFDAGMLDELAQFKVAQASGLRSDEIASETLAPHLLAPLIRRNIEIKARIIEKDERDLSGERALLNFGHTVGHAIESAAEYRDLLHGEAVGLGIVAACHVSVRKAGLTEAERAKVISLLEKFGLPTRLPPKISRKKILDALPLDKKFERGQVRFIVTPAIGSARVANNVTMEDIRDAVLLL